MVFKGGTSLSKVLGLIDRFYEGGKPKYRPAGKNASDAEEQRREFQTRLTAKAIAESAGLTVKSEGERTTLKQAALDYVAKRSVDLGPVQIDRIKYVQKLFFESCKKIYLQDVNERDILAFLNHVSSLPVLRNARATPSSRRNAVQLRLRCPVIPRLLVWCPRNKRTKSGEFLED